MICKKKFKSFDKTSEFRPHAYAIKCSQISIWKRIRSFSQTNQIADMAKYAGQIPGSDQFNKDREDFINIIKSFHKIEHNIYLWIYYILF